MKVDNNYCVHRYSRQAISVSMKEDNNYCVHGYSRQAISVSMKVVEPAKKSKFLTRDISQHLPLPRQKYIKITKRKTAETLTTAAVNWE